MTAWTCNEPITIGEANEPRLVSLERVGTRLTMSNDIDGLVGLLNDIASRKQPVRVSSVALVACRPVEQRHSQEKGQE